MDNISDMDTRISDFAAAAVDALGWRTFEKSQPEDGDWILVTDGEARWVDRYFLPHAAHKFGSHVATHWHPVQDFPVVKIGTEKQK